MGLLSLEQGRSLYRADFVVYGLLVAVAAGGAVHMTPTGQGAAALGWALAGLVGWTLAEYGLHRVVLHGVQPFKRWHALHHARPAALITTPTVLTAAMFAAFVAAPVAWLAPGWAGCALLLGVLSGYLVYTLTHHLMHHPLHRWLRGSDWLRQRQRWHALHHRAGARACYGVSLSFWDRVFRSMPPVRQRTDGSAAAP